ncbi:hypothetical protein KSP40_PGU002269 [Platanthera guangdongensis]|uniref:Uncharacterized protein n=1 Tax=Platanthera guangdongensis TaxID=2320717 RepID=A0ABR2LI36_9ASPA
MRATAGDSAGAPSATTSKPFRGFSALSLRRHQVASLEPSSDGELHLLDLLHSRLAGSLQSLLPPPSAADSKQPSLILSLPFLHKLLDALLACESDFKSLLLLVLSRNPSLILRPPLDRAITDLLDRSVKTLDLCNAVSLALQSLHLWNGHAEIAVSALYRQCPPSAPRQISRARRALSKLLSTGAGLSTSSSSCCRMCRFCSAKRHLQTVTSGLTAPRGGDSASAALLALAVHTITALLHFSLWVMVASFQCGSGELLPPPRPPSVARNMPWAAALDRLHEHIVEEMKRERKEGGYVVFAGMLAETVALGRSGREVLEMAKNGDVTEAAIFSLAIASQKLEEGLGPAERKMREVFHRLVMCREEVLRCLSNGGNSSAT